MMHADRYEHGRQAGYAMSAEASRGRRHAEDGHPYRSLFQRDRERIIHCSAFRRLVGKTQVLVGRINDHHRTRLTHTLEVAQISRTIARRLRLNEDLVEAIALSHDLGHPPFGHAGESALDDCLREFGGFDHNLYGLRRVDLLEDRYPGHPGLNLSYEVREAFIRHSKRADAPERAEFLDGRSALIEMQLVDACDSLAYDTHDTDDALGIGLIALTDLDELSMWRRAADGVRRRFPGLHGERFRTAVIRDLIITQVNDLIDETERRLTRLRIETVDDVRACAEPIVEFSPEMRELKEAFEVFLRQAVYRHPQVMRMAAKGSRFLRQLFAEFTARPELLPERHHVRWAGAPDHLRRKPPRTQAPVETSLHRVVGDYLAGMTDRFARQEYLRLFHPEVDQ